MSSNLDTTSSLLLLMKNLAYKKKKFFIFEQTKNLVIFLWTLIFIYYFLLYTLLQKCFSLFLFFIWWVCFIKNMTMILVNFDVKLKLVYVSNFDIVSLQMNKYSSFNPIALSFFNMLNDISNYNIWIIYTVWHF